MPQVTEPMEENTNGYTARQFIEHYGLDMWFERSPGNPHLVRSEDGWHDDGFHYFCRIAPKAQIAERKNTPGKLPVTSWFSLYYSKGSAHVGFRDFKTREWRMATAKQIDDARRIHGARQPVPIPPVLVEILECLALDFSGVDGCTFEDWAWGCGYDTDSRKAQAIFDTINKQAADFGRLFGRHALRDLMQVHEE